MGLLCITAKTTKEEEEELACFHYPEMHAEYPDTCYVHLDCMESIDRFSVPIGTI